MGKKKEVLDEENGNVVNNERASDPIQIRCGLPFLIAAQQVERLLSYGADWERWVPCNRTNKDTGLLF